MGAEILAFWLIIGRPNMPPIVRAIDVTPHHCVMIGRQLVNESKEPIRVHCVPRHPQV